jgi:hypothetical protein
MNLHVKIRDILFFTDICSSQHLSDIFIKMDYLVVIIHQQNSDWKPFKDFNPLLGRLVLLIVEVEYFIFQLLCLDSEFEGKY